MGPAEAPRALRRESLLDFLPVDDVPPRLDVVGPAVLVFQIVGVLPDVETHDRLLTLHQRIVLVRGARDRELATGVDQPRPARSKPSNSGGAELLTEFSEVSERALDRGPEISPRLAARLRRHDLPEHRVIPVSASVVPDGSPNGF